MSPLELPTPPCARVLDSLCGAQIRIPDTHHLKLPSRRLELSNGGQQEIDGLKKVEELKEKKRRGTLRV